MDDEFIILFDCDEKRNSALLPLLPLLLIKLFLLVIASISLSTIVLLLNVWNDFEDNVDDDIGVNPEHIGNETTIKAKDAIKPKFNLLNELPPFMHGLRSLLMLSFPLLTIIISSDDDSTAS